MSSDSPPGDGDGLTVHGVVQARQGDTLWVAVSRGGCGGCNKKSGCGIGRLSGAPTSVRLMVPARGNERVGDAVDLRIEGADLHRASALAYLAPALGLIIGAGLGDALAGDLSAVLGALSGLALGLWSTRRLKSPRTHRVD